jgi:phosphoribosylanthranilate isomerase
MLKTKVIASSISNLTDARYFAAWGVEAMGFDLRAVSAAQVHAFKDWISGPKVIGEFSSSEGQEVIENAAKALGLDLIQLDVFAPKEWDFATDVIREVIIENTTPEKGTYILKSENPRFELESHLPLLKKFCTIADCYLDLNLKVDHYEIILSEVKPAGIVLRGGAEEKVGFKSFDELDEIMEFLEL